MTATRWVSVMKTFFYNRGTSAIKSIKCEFGLRPWWGLVKEIFIKMLNFSKLLLPSNICLVMDYYYSF